MAPQALPTFCCDAAVPVFPDEETKLHRDENRSLHERIFTSFINFAVKTQHEADKNEAIMASLNSLLAELAPADLDETMTDSKVDLPAPIFASEGLPHFVPNDGVSVLEHPDLGAGNPNNPLSDNVQYVIHLTSRHDFGPVYSHRYFVCPADLHDDWVELTLLQWFAKGKPFDFKAERWDLKCSEHSKFFRLTLRPNLNGRDAALVAGASIPAFLGNLVTSSSNSNLVASSALASRGPTPTGLSPLSSYPNSASGRTPPHPHTNGSNTSFKKGSNPVKPHPLRAQAETFQYGGGKFGQHCGQIAGLVALDFVGAPGSMKNKPEEHKVGITETGGSIAQYYPHSYQHPSNVELDHFGPRYLVQDDGDDFRRSNNIDDTHPQDFPGAQLAARQFAEQGTWVQSHSLRTLAANTGPVQPIDVQSTGFQAGCLLGRHDFGGHAGASGTYFE